MFYTCSTHCEKQNWRNKHRNYVSSELLHFEKPKTVYCLSPNKGKKLTESKKVTIYKMSQYFY